MQQTKEVGSTTKIPDDAQKMFQENEKFVNYVTNLDYTTKSYNKIRTTILDVEKPLVEKQLEDIDQKLLRAEKELSWSTPGRLRIVSSRRKETSYGKDSCHYIELLIVDSAKHKGLLCMIVLIYFVVSIRLLL